MYGIMKSGSLMYNLELMPPLHGYFVMQLFANDVPKTVSSGWSDVWMQGASHTIRCIWCIDWITAKEF